MLPAVRSTGGARGLHLSLASSCPLKCTRSGRTGERPMRVPVSPPTPPRLGGMLSSHAPTRIPKSSVSLPASHPADGYILDDVVLMARVWRRGRQQDASGTSSQPAVAQISRIIPSPSPKSEAEPSQPNVISGRRTLSRTHRRYYHRSFKSHARLGRSECKQGDRITTIPREAITARCRELRTIRGCRNCDQLGACVHELMDALSRRSVDSS